MSVLEQTVLWRRTDSPGHDACGLWSLDDGWQLQGTAVFRLDDVPCHLNYTVECDASWTTRSAAIGGWIGKNPVELVIQSSPDQRWKLNGTEYPELAGLLDVDLGFTPATNLVQLRRLRLGIGQESYAPAVYLSFPDLTLERLEQRYLRITPDKYDYQAPRFSYAAVLKVSDLGFVTHYPGLWELEAIQ